MSGFIVLSDGRAWAASNGAFDAVVAFLALCMNEQGESDLAAWLKAQESWRLGPGMGSIDVRELTARNRALLLHAMNSAFMETIPSSLLPWEPRIMTLRDLVRSVLRGDAPETFNPDMKGLLPLTGEQQGPGW